jgi:hypothetical protein
MSKEDQLLILARSRQNTHWEGFNNIGDYHGGAYECDYVSPYTKSCDNVNSDVMLVLQDWCSHDYLNRPIDSTLIEKGLDPTLPTNKNLERLLNTHLGLSLSDIYATNLLPFIKLGGMSAAIPMKILKLAATEFTRPQIDIVKPNMVVCFGLNTFNALLNSYAMKGYRTIGEAIEHPVFIGKGVAILCQSHPGQLGQNNRNKGGVDRVSEDWRRMSEIYVGCSS